MNLLVQNFRISSIYISLISRKNYEHRVKPEYLLAERITAEDLRDRSVSAKSKSFLDQYGFENTNDLKNPTI